jgi:hypothetical protein
MIPEKVLVNLKILSKIQKNDKLTKSCDGVISLETYQHLQFVKRTLYGDSRVHTVNEIHSIISESVSALNMLFDSKLLTHVYKNTQEWYSVCEDIKLLLKEMSFAKEGIINLKFTYIQDLNINAKLDVYITRLSNVIRDSVIRFSKYSSNPVFETNELVTLTPLQPPQAPQETKYHKHTDSLPINSKQSIEIPVKPVKSIEIPVKSVEIPIKSRENSMKHTNSGKTHHISSKLSESSGSSGSSASSHASSIPDEPDEPDEPGSSSGSNGSNGSNSSDPNESMLLKETILFTN